MLAEGLQYNSLYASHDFAAGDGGLTQESMQALAKARPVCAELASQWGRPEGDHSGHDHDHDGHDHSGHDHHHHEVEEEDEYE